MNTNLALSIAKPKGYDFWWNSAIQMWALTKENADTHYFTFHTLKNMDLDVFVQCYLE